MKAMVIKKTGELKSNPHPLDLMDLPMPSVTDNEILIQVNVCGMCHTELDEIEGRTPPSRFPMVPGHQVIGKVVGLGREVNDIQLNERVGVAWIYNACGRCYHCLNSQENLCKDFVATGRDENGGYAEFMKVPAPFAYPIPSNIQDAEAAPLLCAGSIGYRSLNLANLKDGQPLGLTGFGASAHLVLKMVKYKYPNSSVYVFARKESERVFARSLGAVWAGDTTAPAPELLSAIIDTTPAWKPVVAALKCLKPGGRLVINAIRKENMDKDYLQHLDYPKHLWLEKEIKSVANVTRSDVREFLQLAAEMGIKPTYQEYSLEEANKALLELKFGSVRGAKVLRVTENNYGTV